MGARAGYELCIVGGAGHVGLPLGVMFARAGVKTVLLDVNAKALTSIKKGVFPFKEENGDRELKKALKQKTLFTSTEAKVIEQSAAVLIVIGTPVDEHLHPDFGSLQKLVESHARHFRKGQLLILRSTLYPGTTERIQRYFLSNNKDVSVVFCPERIVQGKSLEELTKLPQIVAAFDEGAIERAAELFSKISPKIIRVQHPTEAELAKLFSNAWRYIKFAVANQFYIMANDNSLDYFSIYQAMTDDYPRNADLPRPGFAAGPCLLKDTMQLAAFNNHSFFLGHSAMLVNQGLPNYIIQSLKKHLSDKGGLNTKHVGILGMAFKAGSDDMRDSLSLKLQHVASAEARSVVCHDPFVADHKRTSLKDVLKRSDIVILGAPHDEYRAIEPKMYPDTLFVDIWNMWSAAQNVIR